MPRSPETAKALELLLNNRRADWQVSIGLTAPFTNAEKIIHAPIKVADGHLLRAIEPGSPYPPRVTFDREGLGSRRTQVVFDSSWSNAKSLGVYLGTREAPGDEVTGLVVSPNGNTVAVACGYAGPASVMLVDLVSGRARLTIPAPTPNYAIAFSPDSKRLAMAGPNNVIELRDPESGQVVGNIANAHAAPLRGLAYSHDGFLLASCSQDGTVKIWDVLSGKEPLRLRAILKDHHPHWVTDVAFSPDSKYLASASYDATVKIWDAKEGGSSTL
jgi:WD40 repeat protein